MVRLAKHRECKIYETGPTYLIVSSSLIFCLLTSSQSRVAIVSFLPSQASLFAFFFAEKEGRKERITGRKAGKKKRKVCADANPSLLYFSSSSPHIAPAGFLLLLLLLHLFHVLVSISVPFSSFLIHGRRSASSRCCGWDRNDPRLLVQPFLPFLLQMARFFTLLLHQILFRSNPSDLLFLSMLNSLIVLQVCIILPLYSFLSNLMAFVH